MSTRTQRSYAPHSTRRAMLVTVRLANGQVKSYDGLFAHTFDGYDDALMRFGKAAVRIEVQVLRTQQTQQLERTAA